MNLLFRDTGGRRNFRALLSDNSPIAQPAYPSGRQGSNAQVVKEI